MLVVSRDVKEDKDLDTVKKWCRRILTTTMTFLIHEHHEARYWYSVQARENITASAGVVCRTTLQRIFEVVRFRDARIKAYGAAAGVSAAVAKAYQEKLFQARSADHVTRVS